jgi:hypothetical protein
MLLHAAMRYVALLLVAGACSSAQMVSPDEDGPAAVDARADGAGGDAQPIDAQPIDAQPIDAQPIDAQPIDAPGTTCAIATGDTIVLDGDGDLDAYPATQRLFPGAQVAATDEVAITWDPTYLYVTVRSEAFGDGSRPMHLYLETASALGTATPADGKEYGGLVAELPFTPNYLIAIRPINDFGSGPYDGVYAPAPWTTQSHALVPGTDVFISSDSRTLSVRTPWTALGGCPLAARAALHVVNGAVANEWKDLVPTTHTPWTAPGGAFYQLALDGDPAISGWNLVN